MSFDRLRTADKVTSVASAALLVVYVGVVVLGLTSPSRDPQQGMAQGFLTFVAVVLLSLAALLWRAVARGRASLIRTLFALIAFTAASQTAQEIHLLVHRASQLSR